jgi:N-acetylneuraminate synthase
MQETIDKTRTIAKSFTGTPKIVIHVGGMSLTPYKNTKELLELAKDSFRKLDAKGVELLPENLPPFGWFFSGLWHCNIFGKAEEMIEFCKELNLKMCLDISHARLFATHNKIDFLEYIQAVAPYVAHLHVSDGKGSHKEGLQIDEGEVPFKETFETLEKYGKPNISWVPEIWQGHLHNYREFRIALEKLTAYPLLTKNHEH